MRVKKKGVTAVNCTLMLGRCEVYEQINYIRIRIKIKLHQYILKIKLIIYEVHI